TDIDARLRCAAVHLIGQTHRAAPHVIDQAGAADQPAHHVAGVDPYSQAQLMHRLSIESVDDATDFEGEIDSAMDAVQPGGDHPATGQVTVVECANPFDTKGFGGRIELPEEIVDRGDQLVFG